MGAPHRKGSTRGIKYLRPDELRRLFEAGRDRSRRTGSVRDELLLHVMYRYGLRASEACGLRASDVDAKGKRIRVVGLKGGESASYRLGRDLLGLMRRYRPGDVWYFASREGDGRLSRTRVWQIVTGIMREAGLPTTGPDGYNVHSLRHSAAVAVLDSGRSVEDAQDLLRHRSLASTLVYARVSERRRGDYLRHLEASDAVVKVPNGKRTRKPRLGLVGSGT